MVEVREVKSRREFKKFVKFPTKLHHGKAFYVPAIELDEFNLTNPKKNASFDDAEAAYFLAYRDGKVVGRISALICRLYNEKNGTKRARFGRFDLIDDAEVAKALFKAAEDWAKERGMEDIHGPLGFNDLEREGLMTYGFDTIGTFQGSCNDAYYEKHVVANGYEPDARWVEWRINTPKEVDPKIKRVADIVQKRYGFYEKQFKNPKDVIDNYGHKIFELLDECYAGLYGTIPFSDKLVDQTIDLFKLVLDKDYISIIFDSNDEIAGFGIGYPSLAKAMQKSKGRYLPFGLFRMLHAIKHPKTLELALIAVKPKYQRMGVTALIMNNMLERIIANKIEYCDTGSQLETNTSVLNTFEILDKELVRKKVCYIKNLK